MTKKAETTAKATATQEKKGGFSAEERAAMKQRAKELKAENDKAGWEAELLSKIEEMPEPDRSIAARLHDIIKTNAPMLTPKTWYGFPAYADKDGKIVCFFQTKAKFGARYGTLGFNDAAHLDDGDMWPTTYAINALNGTVEKKIAELVKKAVS
jgi:uncharacterized protein YdhG (YjbR/CyaY superfamily)